MFCPPPSPYSTCTRRGSFHMLSIPFLLHPHRLSHRVGTGAPRRISQTTVASMDLPHQHGPLYSRGIVYVLASPPVRRGGALPWGSYNDGVDTNGGSKVEASIDA